MNEKLPTIFIFKQIVANPFLCDAEKKQKNGLM